MALKLPAFAAGVLPLLCCVMLMSLIQDGRCADDDNKVTQYTAQVRIYVDEKAFSEWKEQSGKDTKQEMTREIKSMFFEAQEIYKSLTPFEHFEIKFQILDTVYMSETIVRYVKDNEKSLGEAREWIKKQDGTYDLAIMFIGNKLKGGVLGVAYIGSICTRGAVGILKSAGTYKDVLVLAHEMGHIFGMEHDPDTDDASSCYYNNGKVMNPNVLGPKATNTQFSDCSGSYIRGKIETLTREGKMCLNDGNPNVGGPQFMSIMTPDSLCMRHFGKNAFFNQEKFRKYPDSICVSIPCWAKKSWQSKYYEDKTRTPPGMTCAKNRECYQGKCVPTSTRTDNPFVDENCLHGDQKKMNYYPYYYDYDCVDLDQARCDEFGKICCHTCNTTKPVLTMTADQVCQKLTGSLTSQLMRGAYKGTYGDRLCSSLQCISGTKQTYLKPTKHTAPDGMACGKDKRCYQGKCRDSSLKGVKTVSQSDQCPFGDQDLKALGYKYGCSSGAPCKSWLHYCCQSCAGKS